MRGPVPRRDRSGGRSPRSSRCSRGRENRGAATIREDIRSGRTAVEAVEPPEFDTLGRGDPRRDEDQPRPFTDGARGKLWRLDGSIGEVRARELGRDPGQRAGCGRRSTSSTSSPRTTRIYGMPDRAAPVRAVPAGRVPRRPGPQDRAGPRLRLLPEELHVRDEVPGGEPPRATPRRTVPTFVVVHVEPIPPSPKSRRPLVARGEHGARRRPLLRRAHARGEEGGEAARGVPHRRSASACAPPVTSPARPAVPPSPAPGRPPTSRRPAGDRGPGGGGRRARARGPAGARDGRPRRPGPAAHAPARRSRRGSRAPQRMGLAVDREVARLWPSRARVPRAALPPRRPCASLRARRRRRARCSRDCRTASLRPHARRAGRRRRRRRRRSTSWGSRPRPCAAVSRGSRCRPPSSGWPTPRWAARSPSTRPRGKNLLGTFHPPGARARGRGLPRRRCPSATSSRASPRCGRRGASATPRSSDAAPPRPRPTAPRAWVEAMRRAVAVKARLVEADERDAGRAPRPQLRPHRRPRARDAPRATTRCATARRSRSGSASRTGSPRRAGSLARGVAERQRADARAARASRRAPPPGVRAEDVLRAIGGDKKRRAGGLHTFVLPVGGRGRRDRRGRDDEEVAAHCGGRGGWSGRRGRLCWSRPRRDGAAYAAPRGWKGAEAYGFSSAFHISWSRTNSARWLAVLVADLVVLDLDGESPLSSAVPRLDLDDARRPSRSSSPSPRRAGGT